MDRDSFLRPAQLRWEPPSVQPWEFPDAKPGAARKHILLKFRCSFLSLERETSTGILADSCRELANFSRELANFKREFASKSSPILSQLYPALTNFTQEIAGIHLQL